MKPENLEPFRQRFEDVVSATIKDKMLVPEIEIDDTIVLTDITPKFYNILKQFAPFGPGNLSPIFCTEDVRDSGYSRIVGSNHLKLSIFHRHISSLPYNGIAFQQGEYYPLIQKGMPFSICYHIEENEWNGKVSLQLNVKDIRFD